MTGTLKGTLTFTESRTFPVKTLGQRIRLARSHALPRSQTQFGIDVAKREGRKEPYSEATISKWESNRQTPTIAALAAIASEGSIRAEWLTFFSGEAL